MYSSSYIVFFFFNDTATTEIYTLSLHDALPISRPGPAAARPATHDARAGPWPHRQCLEPGAGPARPELDGDRKSTRLNSSHANISYAVFCLKKKKNIQSTQHILQNTTSRFLLRV